MRRPRDLARRRRDPAAAGRLAHRVHAAPAAPPPRRPATPTTSTPSRAGTPSDRDFSLGKANPVQIVVDGPADAAAVKEGVARLQAALAGRRPLRAGAGRRERGRRPHRALGAARRRPGRRRRRRTSSSTCARASCRPPSAPPPRHVYVAGTTAGVVDYLAFFDRWLPIALAVVLEPELRAPARRLPLDRDRRPRRS